MSRLPTGILVSALLRRVNDSGGFAVVRAKGDAQAGMMLMLVDEADGLHVFERGIGPAGTPALIDSTPTDGVEGYWQRRRSRDPDLWVIELSSADAQRFIAETIFDE